jgi:hypothetical protein
MARPSVLPTINTMPFETSPVILTRVWEPCRGAGIKPGASAPGRAHQNTPSPEGTQALAPGGQPGSPPPATGLAPLAHAYAPSGLGNMGGSLPGAEAPGSMPMPLRGSTSRQMVDTSSYLRLGVLRARHETSTSPGEGGGLPLPRSGGGLGRGPSPCPAKKPPPLSSPAARERTPPPGLTGTVIP